MACTNCFSGCVSTTSDKCVKYTGNNIELLGIETGDTLESVEKAITDYLLTVFTGDGIVPTIDPNDICSIVSSYLPVEGDWTLVEVLTAVIKAICEIETLISAQTARIDAIEADYTVGCINVAVDGGTHSVLQAVITALCTAIDDIDVINNFLSTVITTSTINSYIQNYLNSIPTANYWYTKMIPYAVYPFYPSATALAGAFGSTGEGLGGWDKVYLCNGNNGTPDLRGRSLIGVVNSMLGGTLDTEVDPASGNPNYVQGQTNGNNSVVLAPDQVAAHTHTAVATVTDPGHSTSIHVHLSTETDWDTQAGTFGNPVVGIEDAINGASSYNTFTATTSSSNTGITVGVINDPNVGGVAHDNIHPVYALYYIIYLP